MENTNEVTVQIKKNIPDSEKGTWYYDQQGSIINVEEENSYMWKMLKINAYVYKNMCTVVIPPSVEETEGKVKGMHPEKVINVSNETAEKIREVFESKQLMPAPEPKLIAKQLLGVYEGVEILEGQIVYCVQKESLSIRSFDAKNGILANWPDETDRASKVYITPEAVNARLLEEVEKKAKQKTFTGEQIDEWMYDTSVGYEFLKYAIELIEKEFNVRYL